MARRAELERARARYAWEQVSAVKSQAHASEYRALARSAGAGIQSNGLGQTLAFWLAKGQPAHKALYDHVSGWVRPQLGESWSDADLLPQLVAETTSSDVYRRARSETMAVLVWLKRFAEAELAED